MTIEWAIIEDTVSNHLPQMVVRGPNLAPLKMVGGWALMIDFFCSF